MGIRDPQVKAELLRRLRRIEGQTRGVARMVEEGRDCQEVLQQLSAVRAAAHQAGLYLMRSFAVECMRDSESSPDQVAETLVRALERVL